MKKKLALGLLAAALTLTLVIGGTLMLFTDQSEPATNVVTMGDGLKVELLESDLSIPNKISHTIGQRYASDQNRLTLGDYAQDGTFRGIKVENAMPGYSFHKQVKVKNGYDRNTPESEKEAKSFYTAVYGKFTFKQGETPLTWERITAIINQTYETAAEKRKDSSAGKDETFLELKSKIEALEAEDSIVNKDEIQELKNYAFLDLMLANSNNLGTRSGRINRNWVEGPIVAKDSAFYTVWYYIGSHVGKNRLAAISPGTPATDPPIFNTVTIPDELGDMAQGITIGLDIKAYAVQSANVEIEDISDDNKATAIDEWEKFFGIENPSEAWEQ
ncbi:MAG: SipW-dependent-type signal peptide-containing protein [Clostridiales Family XIII bacterium]|jgi:predicted ribosomally synthesized peptide with SipW-like signal peptide|nr:SipW-dependent-type signal peptide-containing protein [Clostridiales Family XIII bacterium]